MRSLLHRYVRMRLSRRVGMFAAALAAVVLCGMGWVSLAPTARYAVAFAPCYFHGAYAAQSECAFSVIQGVFDEDGAGAALRSFDVAHRLFPRLDLDCHAGIHRVGDMMYYRDYSGTDTAVVPEAFPPEALRCNHGFYHGIFEHLFQDHPDPAFIVETCAPFRNKEDERAGATYYTCYHAAGHGLFRAQAEQVSREEWGNPHAFVRAPAAKCAALPHATAFEKFHCTTGVESIFIQTSMLGEFGLSDPEWDHGLKICDQLDPALHESCYYVRALMVSQMTNGHAYVMDRCSDRNASLFRQCMNGVVAGLVVNGMEEASLDRTLDMCRRGDVTARGMEDHCYRQIIAQIAFEYLGGFVPDCGKFPEAYRDECRLAGV